MALVQAVAANRGGSGGNLPITVAATSAGNTLVVVGVAVSGGQALITGVTDNASGGSNTYTKAIGAGNSSVWYCLNAPNGGATIVTIVYTSGKSQGWVVEESGTSALDGTPNINAGQSATTTPHSNNITTASASAVAFGFSDTIAGSSAGYGATGGAGGGTWAVLAGTGFTAGENDNPGNSAICGIRMVLTSAATFQATMVSGLGSGQDSGVIAFSLAATVASYPLIYTSKQTIITDSQIFY